MLLYTWAEVRIYDALTRRSGTTNPQRHYCKGLNPATISIKLPRISFSLLALDPIKLRLKITSQLFKTRAILY